MQEILRPDRVLWIGNKYEIRRQIIRYMNKYNLVKELIKEKTAKN